MLPGVRGRGARPPARCAAGAGRGRHGRGRCGGGGRGLRRRARGSGRRGCRFGSRAREAGHRGRRPRRPACRLRRRACRIRGWACGFRSGACRFRNRARGVGHRTCRFRSRACGFCRACRFRDGACGFCRAGRFRDGFRRRFRGPRGRTRGFHPARRADRPDRLRLPSGTGSGRRPAATPRGLRGPPQVRPAVAAEVVVLAVGRTACRTRAHRVSLLSLRSSGAPRRAGPAGSPPGR
ncbi:hypothetical protein JHY03_50790 [Streptomyces sp. CA-256286]|nr:hypothetical protein JHY03_50790 [Streptomyces sp. CA-256286]